MNTLHIYAQEIWHGDAYIVGTPAALRMVREAIDAALQTGHIATECCACDGEGYTLYVMSLSEEQMDRLIVPYEDEIAKNCRLEKVGPWDLWRGGKYEAE